MVYVTAWMIWDIHILGKHQDMDEMSQFQWEETSTKVDFT